MSGPDLGQVKTVSTPAPLPGELPPAPTLRGLVFLTSFLSYKLPGILLQSTRVRGEGPPSGRVYMQKGMSLEILSPGPESDK